MDGCPAQKVFILYKLPLIKLLKLTNQCLLTKSMLSSLVSTLEHFTYSCDCRILADEDF